MGLEIRPELRQCYACGALRASDLAVCDGSEHHKAYAQAARFVRACAEDEGPDASVELRGLFVALIGREPDADDEEAGLWNLCCAEVAYELVSSYERVS